MRASTVNTAALSSNSPHAEKRPLDVQDRTSRIAQQYPRLAAIDPADLAHKEVKDWPTIKTPDGSFIPEFWVGKRIARSSQIGGHGDWLAKVVNNAVEEGLYWWAYYYYNKTFKVAATSSATIHLKSQHRERLKAEEGGVEQGNKRQRLLQLVQQQHRAVLLPHKLTLRERLLAMILRLNLLFNIVQQQEFRDFCTNLNPDRAAEALPSSHTTIRTYFGDRFDAQKEVLRHRLLVSPYKKHLSFDIWTSPSTVSYMAIFVHYADRDGALHHDLLAIPHIHGSYSGENQALYLIKVAKEYGIEDSLGYFQCDNVDSNSLAVKFTLGALDRAFDDDFIGQLSLEEEEALLVGWRKQGPVGKLYNVVHFIRRSPQRRETFLQIARGQLSEEEAREFGSVVFDRNIEGLQLCGDNSTRWNSVFYMIQRAVRMRAQVDFWCHRNQGEKDPKKRLPTADLLEPSDWHQLTLVLTILEPFRRITKWFEGRSASFPEVIATTEWLTNHLADQQRILHPNSEAPTEFTGGPVYAQPEITVASQQAQSIALNDDDDADDDAEPFFSAAANSQRPRRKRRLPSRLADSVIDLPRRLPTGQVILPVFELADDLPALPSSPDPDDDHVSFVRTSLQLAIQKLQEYIGLMEESPAYWVAMLLHPGHKKRWMDKCLSPDRARKAFAACRDLYQAEYADLPIPTAPQPPALSGPGSHLRSYDYYDPPEDLGQKDELAEYFAEPVWPVDDIQTWWLAHKERWPRLSRMALDLLSIPAMSSECERAFSQAKLVIGTQRHSLVDDTINILMCLKSWGLF